MNKKGAEFSYTQIIIFLILLATLIVVLLFYGGLRDKIMTIFGEVF